MNGSFITKDCALIKQIIYPNGTYHLYSEGTNINCWVYPREIFEIDKQNVIVDSEIDKQSVVYFLVSDDEYPRRIYIGQTTDFRDRMGTHIRDKGKRFTYIVALFRDSRNWNTSIIEYMESKYIEIFKHVHKNKIRYILQNSVQPRPVVGFEDEFIAMQSIKSIKESRLLETALGDRNLFKEKVFFEPIEAVTKSSEQVLSTKEVQEPEVTVNVEESFVTKTAGITANAVRNPNGIEIQKGSHCKRIWSEQNISRYPKVYNLREDLVQQGVLKLTNDGKFYEFTKNCLISDFDTATKLIKGVMAGAEQHWQKNIQSNYVHIKRKKGTVINAYVKKSETNNSFLILAGSEAKVKSSKRFEKTELHNTRQDLFKKLVGDGTVVKKDENKYVFVKSYSVKSDNSLLQTITGGQSSNIDYYAKLIRKEDIPSTIQIS